MWAAYHNDTILYICETVFYNIMSFRVYYFYYNICTAFTTNV